MIKVNLLPSRTQKRKRTVGAGSAFVFVLFLLLVAEVVVLYLWYSSVNREFQALNAQSTAMQANVQRLQAVRQEIERDEAQRALLVEQNRILEALKAGKVGPPNMLMFMSYVLTQPSDTLANREELKAMERAGWNMQWDSDSVWLRRIREDDRGTVTLFGEARTHEDAAEFYQRLRSSIYFRNLEPRRQERRFEQGIEMNYIAFEGRAEINYDLPAPPEEDADELGERDATP